MGGGLALQLAIHEPRLAACVVNYGSLPTEPVDIEKIDAQVLGLFGSLDRGIPPDKVRAFERHMNDRQNPSTLKSMITPGTHSKIPPTRVVIDRQPPPTRGSVPLGFSNKRRNQSPPSHRDVFLVAVTADPAQRAATALTCSRQR